MSATIVIATYCQSRQQILGFLERLSDEQWHWRPPTGIHSIAFHAWHVGRWADHLQASIPGMSPELGRRLAPGVQIWQAEGLAYHWGFDIEQYGYAETGMSMPDEIAMRLLFPSKALILDYIGKVFTAVDHAVRAIDDQQFTSAEQKQPLTEGIWGGGTIGEALMSHLTHDHRHLGMMECLLGLQGQPGTASR